MTLAVTADVHVSSDQEQAATGDSTGNQAEPDAPKQEMSNVGVVSC